MKAMAERMIPAVIAFAIAVIFLTWSHAYEGRAHVVPMLIGWSAVVLTLVDILAQTNTRTGLALRGLLTGRPLDSSSSANGGTSSAPIIACLWTAAFVGLVALIGFIVAIPLYMLFFMRFQGRLAWRNSALFALLITAVIWVVFEQFLQYRIFEGMLFGGQF